MKRLTAIILVVLTILSITSCAREGWKMTSPSKTIEDNSITYIYDKFTGKKIENIYLEHGQRPEIMFNVESISGSLDVFIQDEYGKTVYENYDIQSGEFLVELSRAGDYKVILNAEDHVGSYNMTWSLPKASSDEYVNPYENLAGGKWLKANFHTHAGTGPGTCGVNPQDVVIETYKQLGYELLTISNHDIFTDTSNYTDDKILMIPGVEYSPSSKGHMLTIGITQSLHEHTNQKAIEMTNEMGGFVVLAHPNWGRQGYWPLNELLALKGYIGIEVINQLIYRLSGSGLATNAWDLLLSRGKLVYGFGNDDLHALGDAGRSFNIIYCKERTWESMKEAIDNGQFVASTGLYPEYLVLDGDTIRVKASYPIDTYVDTFTYRFIENGKVLSEQTAREGVYKLNGEKYVRVEVIGENGAMLFFQPVYLKDTLVKP